MFLNGCGLGNIQNSRAYSRALFSVQIQSRSPSDLFFTTVSDVVVEAWLGLCLDECFCSLCVMCLGVFCFANAVLFSQSAHKYFLACISVFITFLLVGAYVLQCLHFCVQCVCLLAAHFRLLFRVPLHQVLLFSSFLTFLLAFLSCFCF